MSHKYKVKVKNLIYHIEVIEMYMQISIIHILIYAIKSYLFALNKGLTLERIRS